jgi:hypothetical protein
MLLRATRVESEQASTLDLFDRVVILYLVLPVFLFLFGWLELWAALPLALCVLYGLRSLVAPPPADGAKFPVSRMQLAVACVVGCAWTLLGGTDHFVFANYDWHIRDAVLHDLVTSPWPVSYAAPHGQESLLRAPLGYYLPAALVGKLFGLGTAHLMMALWTAAGATLFLLQVLSLTTARLRVILAVAVIIVLFSGFDIVGTLLSNPARNLGNLRIAQHLEWWAGRYQYSSMTTQLFWVPNHALAAWLTIGLLGRDSRRSLDAMLPLIVIAAALWSPLSALGLVPFMLLKVLQGSSPDRLLRLVHPRVWAPALPVGLVIAGYLGLDASHVPFKLNLNGDDAGDLTMDLMRQLQFFLLEAGVIGFMVLALRWSWEVVLALVVLLVLPTISFGPSNDLTMRASIPSLAVLAIAVSGALTSPVAGATDARKKLVLACMFCIGAVTPVQEMARAILLPAFPINMTATLIGAACGQYPAHYTARLKGQFVSRLLRAPHRIPLAPQGPEACFDPAYEMSMARGLL